MEDYYAIESSKEWISKFVIKHNICPFAKRVFEANEIVFFAETSRSFEELAMSFITRISHLKASTAFVLYRTQFPDFLEFLDFYYACEAILEDSDYDATYQIVAFHPEYLFEGEASDDPSNLTNRSPFPMIHILRRDHVEKAIEAYGNIDDIPQRNIDFLRALHK